MREEFEIMYKIYCHDQALILGSPDESQEATRIEVKQKKPFLDFVKAWLNDENRTNALVFGYEEEKMFQHFRKIFKYIEAAGGVVRNSQNRVLFIRRWGIWDLPKGKIDNNEQVTTCALREVEEETGVSDLHISASLNSSYHLYTHKKEWRFKKTFWFLMDTPFGGDLEPQLEEDITEARWLDVTECRSALHETYRSLRESIGEEVCNVFEKNAKQKDL